MPHKVLSPYKPEQTFSWLKKSNEMQQYADIFMFMKWANYLHFFYVFFKIFIHIEYLKKHITSIKIKIIHSYVFQSPYDHHQGVFKKYFLYEVAKIYLFAITFPWCGK